MMIVTPQAMTLTDYGKPASPPSQLEVENRDSHSLLAMRPQQLTALSTPRDCDRGAPRPAEPPPGRCAAQPLRSGSPTQ